jgi:hypothetical protein
VATDRGADSADGHAGMVRELLSGELDPCRLGRLGDLLDISVRFMMLVNYD